MLDSRVLDQLVAASRELYSLPTVAMRVLELTSQPSVDSQGLKQCIEQDPALTAKILRVVNSSLFGLSSQIADLGQAVTLLGIKPLKLLVLGFCLPDRLFQNLRGPTLSWYWRRTLTKAVSARELSQRVWNIPGDEGFVVGLLADLGLLAFVQSFGEPYLKFLERVRQLSHSLEQAERGSLGFDHRQFTVRLMEQWHLPDKLYRAIAANVVTDAGNLPAVTSEASPLARVLHQADLLTELLCDQRPGVLGELLQCGDAPLSEEQLRGVVISLSDKVRQLAETLHIDLDPSCDYEEVLAEARRQLSLVAVEAAIELTRRGHGYRDGSGGVTDDDALSGSEQEYEFALAAAASAVSERTSARTSGTASTPSATDESPEIALIEQLSLAVQISRRARTSLSLLIIEASKAGIQEQSQLRGVTRSATNGWEGLIASVDLSDKVLVPLGSGRLAIGLSDCDRSQVGELTRGMVQFLMRDRNGRKVLPLAMGAATVSRPSPNFDVARLLDAAERCCYASRAAGGNVLKSIEIF